MSFAPDIILQEEKETDEEKNGNFDVYGNCGKYDCFLQIFVEYY